MQGRLAASEWMARGTQLTSSMSMMAVGRAVEAVCRKPATPGSRRPKRTLPVLGRVSVFAVALAVATGAAADGATGKIESLLRPAVEREHAAGRFDGVVLVGRGNAVVFQQAIGWADRETRRAHRLDEGWRWASVSKQVTALLVMQQVEQGRLTLDARLDSLLPSFASPQASSTTVEQLLRHTSGLPNPDDTLPADASPDAMPPYYQTAVRGAVPVDAALAYCAGPPKARPGAGFSYNNCDTLVLQAVLERLMKQPFAQLLASSVSRPLDMRSLVLATGASVPETPVGYLDAQRREPSFNLATFGASGALVGTAEDLWRFDRALMQHQLLGEEATRRMWEGDPTLGYVALGAWSFTARLSGCDKAVALVERRGEIGGVQVRNLLAPSLNSALLVFSNTALTEFGEIWQGKGLMHEMASAAFCSSSP